MLRAVLLLMLFLQPAILQAQIVLGIPTTQTELDNARKTIALAAPKIVELGIDEFEVVVPNKDLKIPIQWLYDTFEENPATEVILVPAGKGYMLRKMKKYGEASARNHDFPPQEKDWLIIIGSAKGRNSVYMNRNGDDAKNISPQGIAKLIVKVIGDVEPDPVKPPPVIIPETELVKAFREAYAKDAVAGKGGKDIALAIADTYASLSRSDISKVPTVGALNATIGTAIGSNVTIPPPEKVLTEVRTLIMRHIYTNLGVNANSDAVPLSDEMRTKAKAIFAEVAKSLEASVK